MQTLNDYLTNLAGESPAPGGGSAAMLVGATAAALVAMVARICAASQKYRAKHDLALGLISQADALREELLARKTRDEQAFEAVVAARGDAARMQAALQHAAAVPLEGAQDALGVLELCVSALELGNAHLASDVGCAAEFASAALRACAYNVRINHKYMSDAQGVSAQRAQLESLEQRAAALLRTVREAAFVSIGA